MSKVENIAPEGMYLHYRLRELAKPSNWLFELKQDRQRKQRGWSDRDTWGTGDYILEVVAGMLKKLGDKKSHIDWDEYFKTNYPKNLGYESLYEVAADIDSYLEFERSSWADTLGFKLKGGFEEKDNDMSEYVNRNTPKEKALINKAIKQHAKEYKRRYKKASNAMKFVALNFPALWD